NMCRQSMPEAGSSAAVRSAGRQMSSIVRGQFKEAGKYGYDGSPLYRPRAGKQCLTPNNYL
ncbi:MAG TPA: hypothetical protein PKE17_18880, partial [Saprospiraceae bacterium]|nr:hypothetical protein [Saprospiraceae bacterium]